MSYYHPNIISTGFGLTSDLIMIAKEINPPMRERPSIVFSYITDGYVNLDLADATVNDNNYTNSGIQYIRNAGKITVDKNYSIAFDAIADL